MRIFRRCARRDICLLNFLRHMSSHDKTYLMTGVGVETVAKFSWSGRHEVTLDVPQSMGGKNVGPQPVELFLASLCGCEQVTALFIARHMKPRVKIDKIEFKIQASRDQRTSLALPIDTDNTRRSNEVVQDVSRLKRIWGIAIVHTAASQEEVDIIAKETEIRCPIANMVMLSGCDLDIQFFKAPPAPDDSICRLS